MNYLPSPSRLCGWTRLESGLVRFSASVVSGQCSPPGPAGSAWLFCPPHESGLLASSSAELLHALSRRPNAFVFLIPDRPPPEFAFRVDPPVRAFAFGAGIGARIFSAPAAAAEINAFDAFRAAMASPREVEVYALGFSRCRELPKPGLPAPARYNWIVPHGGSPRYVPECLASLRTAAGGSGDEVLFGVDGRAPPQLRALLSRLGVRGFETRCQQRGPYVVRNLLMQRSRADYAVFQDSDDIACADRLPKLLAGFHDPRVGLVGSHELRLDEINRRVVPVRYPLDVSAALRLGPTHALLHPTSAVRPSMFRDAGGFSTHTRHSLDTQFLLRAHGFFEVRNVDAFVYVRRWHPKSLCTRKSTALGSARRASLLISWGRGFIRLLATNRVAGTTLVADRQAVRGIRLHLVETPRRTRVSP